MPGKHTTPDDIIVVNEIKQKSRSCVFWFVFRMDILSESSEGCWQDAPGSLSLHTNRVQGYQCLLWPPLPEIFFHPENRMITRAPRRLGLKMSWTWRGRKRDLGGTSKDLYVECVELQTTYRLSLKFTGSKNPVSVSSFPFKICSHGKSSHILQQEIYLKK